MFNHRNLDMVNRFYQTYLRTNEESEGHFSPGAEYLGKELLNNITSIKQSATDNYSQSKQKMLNFTQK